VKARLFTGTLVPGNSDALPGGSTMFTSARVLGLLVFVLGVGLVAAGQTGKPVEHSPAVAAVLKLADNLEAPDVAIQAKKIVTEINPCGVSRVFTVRRPPRGGVGIGSAVQAGHKDSIDDLVRDWAGARPPTLKELQTHRKDLLQVSRVLQAMAELAPHRVSEYVPQKDEKRAGEWRKVSAEFKAATRELRDAVEKTKPDETRKAAVRLKQTCVACHMLVGF
jgi:hypothetical protein